MIRQITTHPVSPSRIFFCLIFLTALSVVAALSFQSRSITVVPSGGTRVETVPGKLLTLSFKVTNTSSSRKRFESSVVTPKGWRRLAKDFPFELEAGGSDIRLLSISIPAETPAETYTLHYSIKDPSDPTETAEVTMTIVVTGIKEQGLKLMESPRIAVAGEPYTSIFALNNGGNVTNVVHVSVRSSAGFRAVPDSVIFHVGPGETRTIRVNVSTDATLIGRLQDVLELTAELDSNNVAKASSFVEVVPRVTGTEERYVRFPVVAKIRFAGEQDKRGTQFEIAGAGPLGNNRDNRLDLLIRTPDIQQKSVLGRRDEYQLAYTTKSYDAFLGDKNFSLSPLTEFNRYAFGISGNTKMDKYTAGGFYNQTRFYTPAQKEWAGYLNYHALEAADIGINYLGKYDQSASNVATLRTLARPFKSSELELEYGVSVLGGHTDDAFSARWTGHNEWIAYDSRFVRSGTQFAGYYRDVDLKNVGVNVMPLGDVRIEGFYRDEKRNMNRDTLLFLAPRDRYYQVGVGISNVFAVYYRTNDQEDLLPNPQYRRTEETWQIRLGYNIPDFSIIANADIGSTHDKIAGVKSPLQRFSGYLSIQPFSGQTYGFSAEYTKDHDPATFQPEKHLSGSVNVGIFLGSATQFTFSLFGNRAWGAFEQSYSLLDLGLDHTFPWGHSVALRGRQSIFRPVLGAKEIAYLAEYAIPIGIPVARSTVSGQLLGRVVDTEKGTGVQNVLVYAGGATALTDRNGEYSFPSLKPNKYFIQVDMASVGLNRVTLQQLPYEMTIVGGTESRFDISLSRSVTVTGSIVLYGAKEQAANDTTQPKIVELGGHPNAIVELANGDDVNRRVTDSRGRFTFANMRPGPWTLRIVDGNLPQNYSFDKESVSFTVAPGQSAEHTFKALPRRRRIQIISQGVTIGVSPEKAKEIKPAPEKGKEIKPAPEKAKEIIPVPEMGKEIKPVPEKGKEIVAVPEKGKEIVPAPEKGKEIVPAPEKGKVIVPTPEKGKVIVPAPEKGKEIVAVPEKGKEIVPAPEKGKEIVPVPEKGKEIKTEPERKAPEAPRKPAEAAERVTPKSETTAKVAPKETTKLERTLPQPVRRAARVAPVIFWHEKMSFSIQLSEWSSKSSADSVVAFRSSSTRHPIGVQRVVRPDGMIRYRVLLGAFKSRAAAAAARDGVSWRSQLGEPTVVFQPDKMMFGIDHSEWPTKALADSVASSLLQRTKLAVRVRPVVSLEGDVTYRVVLGVFKSRAAAETALDLVRDLK